MSASQYTYQSAKIRSLEPAILDRTDIERMVDAPDFDGSFKILNDTDYADNLLGIDPANFREALAQDYRQLYLLMKKIIPQEKLLKLLLLEKDLINLKLLFKARQFGQKADMFLEECAYYPPAKLKAYIFDKNDLGLDPQIKQAISEIEKQISENSRPDQIALAVTKEYFRLSQKLSDELRNPFLKELVRIRINNANILTYIRAKKLDLPKDRLAEKIIPGGSIPAGKMLEQYGEELRNLKPLIEIHYQKNIAEIFDNPGLDLIAVTEAALAGYETDFAAKSKLIAEGPEVIAAYYLAKARAAQNIQTILTGKYNKIPTEAIKKYIKSVR